MGLLSLRFSNTALETAFRHDYFHKSLRQMRISLAIGAVLYAGFGVLDPYIIPHATDTAWVIRYALVCPLLLAAIALSFASVFERIAQFTVAAVVLVACLGIIGMIITAQPPGSYYYYAGLLLSCTFINTFMRLRLVPAAGVTWTIVVLYEALVFQRTPTSIYINNTFFLVTVNFVTTYACYFMERSVRTDFLQRRTIEDQASQLNLALKDVELARSAAEEQSRRDPLTNLFNRRYFFDVLKAEIESSRHTDAPLCVLMLDVDHFKDVNDTYGHAVGDQVLRTVAAEIVSSLRESDVHCRYGGEEFVIMLSRTTLEVALEVAHRIHGKIASMSEETPAGVMRITVSVGLAAHLPEDDMDADGLINRADQALYVAKQSGRNRVCVWTPGLME